MPAHLVDQASIDDAALTQAALQGARAHTERTRRCAEAAPGAGGDHELLEPADQIVVAEFGEDFLGVRFQDPQQLEVGGVDRLAQQMAIEHQAFHLMEPTLAPNSPVRRKIGRRRMANQIASGGDHPSSITTHALEAVNNDQLGVVAARRYQVGMR